MLGKGYRRARLRREGLIVFERFTMAAVQELNQRVERREATDLSLVLILRHFIEKTRGRLASPACRSANGPRPQPI